MQFAANNFQLSTAVLTGAGVGDGPAQRLRHSLETVADPENRHTEVEQRRIKLRSTFGVDTGRSTGQHQRQRLTRLDLLDRGGVRDDLGKNPRFSDPARDQLRILRTEVDHQYRSRRCRFEITRFAHAASLVVAERMVVGRLASRLVDEPEVFQRPDHRTFNVIVDTRGVVALPWSWL